MITLLNEVLVKQGQMDDSDFSRKLGIPRTTWLSTKSGKRPIGLTLLKALARTYPELKEEIFSFLRDGMPEKKMSVMERIESLEPPRLRG